MSENETKYQGPPLIPEKLVAPLAVTLARTIGHLADASVDVQYRQPICQIKSHLEQAMSSLTEAGSLLAPQPEWTEQQAELSAWLHTCLRKYDDGPLSVLLYRMISENAGMVVWHVFIVRLEEYHTKKHAVRLAKQSLRNYLRDSVAMSLLDEIMHQALDIWDDGEIISHLEDFYKSEK